MVSRELQHIASYTSLNGYKYKQNEIQIMHTKFLLCFDVVDDEEEKHFIKYRWWDDVDDEKITEYL